MKIILQNTLFLITIVLSSQEKIINLSNYSYPKISGVNGDEFILPIIGTNDIHGAAYEKSYSYGKDIYTVGGYNLLSGLIDLIKKEFNNKVLWLDSGDQFQGTYENINTTGQLMVDFYNAMNVDSFAIGNHEWDNREPQLRKWMKEEYGRFENKTQEWPAHPYAEVPKDKLFLAANLKLLHPKSNDTDLPNKMPYQIFELLDGKIKIGIIGLITKETATKTAGFSSDKFEITDYVKAIEEQAKILKEEKGVNAVLGLTHVGMTCKNFLWNQTMIDEYYKLDLRNINTTQPMDFCHGEMFDMLNKLPEGILDGVISGHIHESMHHFVRGIPVIQNPMSNLFTNIMYLKFKKNKKGRYILQKNETLIEGPIPLCDKIFNSNKRCNTYQEENKSVKLSNFTFHNGTFITDERVKKVFNSYPALTKEVEKLKSDHIFITEVYMQRNHFVENVLGNFVSDIYRNMTNADVGFAATGNLRYIWNIGPVSKYDLIDQFPFGGNFSRYNVTGKNLKKMVKTVQEGVDGIYSFSGVKMNITYYNANKHLLDKNSLTLENGDEIIDDKMYSIASNDFELNGGDMMSKFKVNGRMMLNSTAVDVSLNILEYFEKYLKNLKVLTVDHANSLLGKVNIKYLNK